MIRLSLDQARRQRRADEAGAAGDEDVGTAEVGDGHRVPAPRRDDLEVRRGADTSSPVDHHRCSAEIAGLQRPVLGMVGLHDRRIARVRRDGTG